MCDKCAQVVDTDNSHAISYNEYAHHIIELGTTPIKWYPTRT